MPAKTKKKTAPDIRELLHKEEWLAMYPLIKQLNPDLRKKEFVALLSDMLATGYRCVGAYEDGRLAGVMGFWVGTRFWCRKYIDIDNVVVDEKDRGRGIGKKLLAWIEQEGARIGCAMAVLDSYTTAHPAHRFYLREGYCILGYHIIKRL